MKPFCPGKLLSLLARCAVCGLSFSDWHPGACPVCPECRAGLVPITVPVCRICGVPLSSEHEICLDCRELEPSNLFITSHRSLYYYDPAAARILLALKADGWSRLASFFAPQVDAYLDGLQEDHQLICPVPSLASSIRKRGFDHMRILCQCLASRHRNRVFPFLTRRSGLPQKHLDRMERVKNMESCLEYHDIRRAASANVPPGQKGPVLLLDDVKTTGASLQACASILVSRGWGPVSSLTLFLD